MLVSLLLRCQRNNLAGFISQSLHVGIVAQANVREYHQLGLMHMHSLYATMLPSYHRFKLLQP